MKNHNNKPKLNKTERRAIIQQRLEVEGESEIYVEELCKLNGKSITEESLKYDLIHFKKIFGTDKYERIKDSKGWKIAKKERANFSFKQRLKLNDKSKKNIGQLVGHLIIDSNTELKDFIYSVLEKAKNSKAKSSKIKTIISKFDRFWRSEKNILLDGSTTNYYICKQLIENQSSSKASDLTVFTNGIAIESLLAEQESRVKIKGFRFGGSINLTRSTAHGTRAVKMLDALPHLRFDMGLIGATLIDSNKGKIYADHVKDVEMKSNLLDRCYFKVIVVDSSKFDNPNVVPYEEFRGISPESIDMIITNRPESNHKKTFDEAVRKIEKLGVYVFIAEDLLSNANLDYIE